MTAAPLASTSSRSLTLTTTRLEPDTRTVATLLVRPAASWRLEPESARDWLSADPPAARAVALLPSPARAGELTPASVATVAHETVRASRSVKISWYSMRTVGERGRAPRGSR